MQTRKQWKRVCEHVKAETGSNDLQIRRTGGHNELGLWNFESHKAEDYEPRGKGLNSPATAPLVFGDLSYLLPSLSMGGFTFFSM